jgi:hypothetical protein
MNKTITWLGQIPEYAANKRFEASTLGKIIKSQTGWASTEEVMKLRDALTNNAQWLQEAARSMTQTWFRNNGLQELKKLETDKIMWMVEKNNQYGQTEKLEIKKLVEKLKDWKQDFNENDSYKLQWLLGGDLRGSNFSNIDARNVTEKYWKGWTSGNGENPTWINWVSGWTKAVVDGKQQNHIILSVWNITNQDTKVTLNNSATEIAKWIEGNVSLKWQFTKESLRTALSWIISDPKKLDEIIKAIKDEFFNK